MSKNFARPRPCRLGEYKLVVGTSAITFTTEFINLYFAGKPIYRSWGTGYSPLVTDRVGSMVHNGVRPQSYYPYGEEKSTITESNQDRFATYYRDAFTNFDYAMQRYYHSGSGRFLSPDPYMASGGAADPQSWNRYSYTRNDPVNRTDVTGLQDESPGDIVDCGPFGMIPQEACRFFLQSLGNENAAPFPKTSPGRRDQINGRYSVLEGQFASMADDLSTWFKSGNLSGDCLGLLSSIGVTRDQMASRLTEVTFHNGFESTTGQWELLRAGSAEYKVAYERQLLVGHAIRAGSGTGAMASLNGPDIWLSPFMLTAGQWGRNASVLAHETVHTLNKTDSEIQTAIWGAGSPEVGAASGNISRRFQKDCFSGYGGPR